jgi:hypothetical protein
VSKLLPALLQSCEQSTCVNCQETEANLYLPFTSQMGNPSRSHSLTHHCFVASFWANNNALVNKLFLFLYRVTVSPGLLRMHGTMPLFSIFFNCKAADATYVRTRVQQSCFIAILFIELREILHTNIRHRDTRRPILVTIMHQRLSNHKQFV